jgi:hypothetical protein
MIKLLLHKIKKTPLNLYEELEEELEYTHPKLRFIPTFILKLFSLLIWGVILLLIIKTGLQTLTNLFD